MIAFVDAKLTLFSAGQQEPVWNDVYYLPLEDHNGYELMVAVKQVARMGSHVVGIPLGG